MGIKSFNDGANFGGLIAIINSEAIMSGVISAGLAGNTISLAEAERTAETSLENSRVCYTEATDIIKKCFGGVIRKYFRKYVSGEPEAQEIYIGQLNKSMEIFNKEHNDLCYNIASRKPRGKGKNE